jgi:hypothetical protein
MRRWITLYAISEAEGRFLHGLLWASLGLLAAAAIAFTVIVTTRPVGGPAARKLLGVIFFFAALAIEGLLYYWMRRYTDKKITTRTDPVMYGLFRVLMVATGFLGIFFMVVLSSRS